jgi:hypothetical protein
MKRVAGSRKMQLSSGIGIFACVPSGLFAPASKTGFKALFGAQTWKFMFRPTSGFLPTDN